MTALADHPSTATTAIDGDARHEVDIGYERSPIDVLRAIIFALTAIVLALITRWATDVVVDLEGDLIGALDFVSPPLQRIVSGALQVFVAMLIVFFVVFPIATRRYRLLGYVLTVNALAAGLVVLFVWWLDRARPTLLDAEVLRRGGFGHDFPTSWAIGGLVGTFGILSPFVTRRYRRAGAISLGVIVVGRLLISEHLPAEIFVAIALGATGSAVVLFAYGRPSHRPTSRAIDAALRAGGVRLTRLVPADVDARASVPYVGEVDGGAPMFVKVLGARQRSADLLFRSYRAIRLKSVGDERPFSSLRRSVEHEALVVLYARDVGVRAPRLRAVAEVGTDSMLLAFDMIDGRSVDRLDPVAVDDGLLRRIWSQVAILRRHRIAHRDLRRANLIVDGTGAPWIIDFGFSELAVSDAQLDADVAQLLAALSLVVGAPRAVDSAIAELGTDAVATALPRLQPNALSGATRTAIRHRPGLMKELQDTVIDRCAIEAPHYEQLARLSGKRLFGVVMLIAVTYFLLPQLADLPGIFRQIRALDWVWLPPVIVLSSFTYVGATLGILGSIPERLRPVPTFITQVASSFASTLAPSGLGGMALNVRYLQRSGVDPAVATSGVGLNTVAGVLMHLALLAVFVVWGGRQAFGSFSLPDWHIFAYGILAVAVFAAGAFAVPSIRHMVFQRLVPMVRRSVDGLRDVIRQPGKLLLVFGGSAIVTMSYITCLYLASHAFGGTLGFATVAAVYLAGSAVAGAAPTPGGLGALEAAVIAGLVAAGMDDAVAVPTVFLYRLATFWLPILPGVVGFKWLQRQEYI
ncbi:MAG: flippase-like domain-containing protein [Ilumatobacteraceae bacterium]